MVIIIVAISLFEIRGRSRNQGRQIVHGELVGTVASEHLACLAEMIAIEYFFVHFFML
jgi:hypothetical protein